MRRVCLLSLAVLASCGPVTFQLARVDGQLRLAAPKVPLARATTAADAHGSLYGAYVREGFVDLREGMLLKAVAPLLPAGESLSNELVSARQGEPVVVKSNVIGFTTAFYTVEAAGDAVRIRFRDGEESGGGVVRPMTKPAIALDERPMHWRLFFQTRRSDDDRDITLVGAPSREGLSKPDCRESGTVCIPAPRGVAFSAHVEVTYNGRKVACPLGSTVGELLRNERAAGRGVMVSRVWRGKSAVIQASAPADLLSLPVHGGDRITSPAGRD